MGYGPRYAKVARLAHVPFETPSADDVEIVERAEGGSGTEFGVPALPAAAEDEPLQAGDLDRLVALLQAAWTTFDGSVEAARGVELRKGPRGGGRDLDRIVEHVRGAEEGYLKTLGSRPAAPDMDALRTTFAATLRAVATGAPIADPSGTRKRWAPRYAARRSAWHSLDHAWEIEDRSG